jgi:formylglycine-generating enzyme required for sulfatase activity
MIINYKKIISFLVLNISLSLLILPCHANNLIISNVELGSRNPSGSSVVVEFDISWDNSWRTKINHDATWLTFRLYDDSTPSNKKLCTLTTAGLNPTSLSVPFGSGAEAYVPTDKTGAFIRSSDFNSGNTITLEAVEATLDFSSCGFTQTSEITAMVFGVEMVQIPEGQFYAGDGNSSTASLNQGSADLDPWQITDANAMSVTNPASNGYRYVSNSNSGENATGTSFTIGADFPNGYDSFYVMKYEVTEGQWVEFVNALPLDAARTARDLTNATHKNSDSVKYRNTIACSGSPLTCSTSRPYRATSYLSWMDLTAFLDWAALRPISELEFEKAARGPLQSVAGEFAWGTINITAVSQLSVGDEDGDEIVITSEANTNYNNVTLSGGDTANGVAYTQGPLRAGIYAQTSSVRETAGASYYGVMELSGNVRERVVTIGNATGRNFTATHGDGVVTTTSSYEGNATNVDWPGIDATEARGVTGATGAGVKGGGWDDQSSGARLRVSDRYDAANISTSAFYNTGGRGARNSEEN